MSYALAAPLQGAVFQRLSGDAEVAALSAGEVFDAAPPGQLPSLYVALGPEDVRDRSDQTGHGAVHRFTVTVVSEAGGFQAAKKLAGAVDSALRRAPLTLSEGRVVALRFDRARARRDRNGARRWIELRFYAHVDAK